MFNNNIEHLINQYFNLVGKSKSKDSTSKKENVKEKIQSINDQYFLNEVQKREHRRIILIIVTILIFIQLIFFNVIIGFMLSSIILDNRIFKNIDVATTKLILEFLKYYVSATIVELLGMLLFIIKNVFDWSLKDIINKKLGESD